MLSCIDMIFGAVIVFYIYCFYIMIKSAIEISRNTSRINTNIDKLDKISESIDKMR